MIIKLIFTILLLNATFSQAGPSFTDLRSPDNRRVLYHLPANFNGRLAIFFHGATGNGQVLLDDAPTNDLIQKMLSKGFLVALPDARQDNVIGTFKASWDSFSQENPDTRFVDWIITAARQALPALKQVYLVGGSNGVAMASRIAKNRTDIAGTVMVNGLDCDQMYLTANNVIAARTEFSIPATHAPILLVASKNDILLKFADKQLWIDKARNVGVSAMMLVNDDATGGHNWGEWTLAFHDNMVNWMLR